MITGFYLFICFLALLQRTNAHICHGRKFNLVEFQILLVESASRKSSWTFYQL